MSPLHDQNTFMYYQICKNHWNLKFLWKNSDMEELWETDKVGLKILKKAYFQPAGATIIYRYMHTILQITPYFFWELKKPWNRPQNILAGYKWFFTSKIEFFVLSLSTPNLKKAYFTAVGGKNFQALFITPKMQKFKKYNLFWSLYFPNSNSGQKN